MYYIILYFVEKITLLNLNQGLMKDSPTGLRTHYICILCNCPLMHIWGVAIVLPTHLDHGREKCLSLIIPLANSLFSFLFLILHVQ
jgi:hypothetical protein